MICGDTMRVLALTPNVTLLERVTHHGPVQWGPSQIDCVPAVGSSSSTAIQIFESTDTVLPVWLTCPKSCGLF